MKTVNFLTILAATAAVTGASAINSSSATAETTLRFATWDPVGHEIRRLGMDPYLRAYKDVTGGSVKVKILTKGLGAPPAYQDFITKGAIDIANIIPAYTPGRFLLHKLAEFPFLTDSAEARTVAYWRIHERHFAKVGEAKGMHLLNAYAHGPGMVSNSKRPTNTLSDFKGLKLRVSGDNVSALAKAMGVTPIFAPITKVATLLSKGVADGVYLGHEGIKNFKLGKYLKYTTDVKGGLYSTVFQTYMNQQKWDALSAKDKKAISAHSGERFAHVAGHAWDLADKAGDEYMAKHGIKVSQASPELVAKLKKMWEPIQAEWMKKAKAKGIDGAAVLAEYKAEIAKVEKIAKMKR